MFAHIEGTVADKGADSIVLDVHGIGFQISVSGATLSRVPARGERFKVYTVLNVREDAMELFGFFSPEERQMFDRLRGVSGIGTRTALSILSSLSVRDLSVAVVTGDLATLTRIPGIGRKTAQRLALELKDKIDDSALTGAGPDAGPVVRSAGPEAEAVAALMALGFGSAEAEKAVSRVSGQTSDLQEIIRLALKEPR